jgi:tetratricopeptide (TPR) repeat protein
MESDLRKVHLLYERGEWQKAAQLVDRLILENPSDDKPFQMRAFLLQASGHFKEAASDLDRAIDLNPSEANNFFSSAFVHLQIGNWRRVVSDCTCGLNLGNDYHKNAFLFFRAEALISLGRNADAKADLARIKEETRMWTTQLRTKKDLLSLCD